MHIYKNIITTFLISALCIFSLNVICKASAPEMKIHVINLKNPSTNQTVQGEAVLVESHMKYILIDTGLEQSAPTLIRYLKDNKVKHLDIYISHLHTDHYNGLFPILRDKFFIVHHIYFPAMYGQFMPSIKKEYAKLATKVSKKKKHITHLLPGKVFRMGDALIRILGPLTNYRSDSTQTLNDIKNSYSMPAMITCGKTKYLATSDMNQTAQSRMLNRYRSYLRADIVSASHHGAYSSNSKEWFSYIQPKYVFSSNAAMDKITRTYIDPSIPFDFTGAQKKSIIYHIKNNQIFVNYH